MLIIYFTRSSGIALAVFNTAMEIPHKSSVATEANPLRTGMYQVCQWLIQEKPLWFSEERHGQKVFSQVQNINI